MGLNVVYVDASERFLTALSGVTDPEKKRKIIGEQFMRVFEEEAQEDRRVEFLAQGTIYPDRHRERHGRSATIKSHHNVGGLPEDSLISRSIVEPLQIAVQGRSARRRRGAGPAATAWSGGSRSPAPASPCACVGEITREKLDILRESDAIYPRGIGQRRPRAATSGSTSPCSPTAKSVGVMGDGRTYDYCVALRAVTTDDAMTVEAAELPYPVLQDMRQPHHQTRSPASTASSTTSRRKPPAND